MLPRRTIAGGEKRTDSGHYTAKVEVTARARFGRDGTRYHIQSEYRFEALVFGDRSAWRKRTAEAVGRWFASLCVRRAGRNQNRNSSDDRARNGVRTTHDDVPQ